MDTLLWKDTDYFILKEKHNCFGSNFQYSGKKWNTRFSEKILPLLKKNCIVGKKDSFKADKSFLGFGTKAAAL